MKIARTFRKKYMIRDEEMEFIDVATLSTVVAIIVAGRTIYAGLEKLANAMKKKVPKLKSKYLLKFLFGSSTKL